MGLWMQSVAAHLLGAKQRLPIVTINLEKTLAGYIWRIECKLREIALMLNTTSKGALSLRYFTSYFNGTWDAKVGAEEDCPKGESQLKATKLGAARLPRGAAPAEGAPVEGARAEGDSPGAAAEKDVDVHIACDVCNLWFLLQETGLTAEEADKLDSFQCSQCRAAAPAAAPTDRTKVTIKEPHQNYLCSRVTRARELCM